MCQTFTFHHLCGHVHSEKILKCLPEIERQLQAGKCDDSVTHTVSPSAPQAPALCLHICESEPFLKPDLCDQCAKVGIINDWLKTDPTRRYEMVKEWLQMRTSGSHSGSSTKDPENPRTPRQRQLPDKLKIAEHEVVRVRAAEQLSPLPFNTDTESMMSACMAGVETHKTLDALTIMTPVLSDYVARAELIEAEVDAVQAKLTNRTIEIARDTEQAGGLGRRAVTIRQKLEVLIADAKRLQLVSP